jgi:hypothetical protein
LLSVTLTHLITQALYPTLFPTPLFFAAIVISTWFGGTGPGLFVLMALVTTFMTSPLLQAICPDHVLRAQTAPAEYTAMEHMPVARVGFNPAGD